MVPGLGIFPGSGFAVTAMAQQVGSDPHDDLRVVTGEMDLPKPAAEQQLGFGFIQRQEDQAREYQEEKSVHFDTS
jgi:hypothetical protein